MRPAAEHDLLQAYLDGCLDDDRVRALEQRLIREPRLADALMLLARDDGLLRGWATARPRPAPLPAPRIRWPRSWGRASAVAAALLLAFLAGYAFWSSKTPPRETAAAGRVEEVQGEVFIVPDKGEPVAAQPGQRLAVGERVQTRGGDSFAVVALGESSRLELGADTTVRLGEVDALKRVFFEQGVMDADAGPLPEAAPMVVATPHAEARLRDARVQFASVGKGTRIEQEKGKARITRVSDGRFIDMLPGSFAVASTSGAFTAEPVAHVSGGARQLWPDLPAQSLAYAPGGQTIAVGCADGTVKLCEAATGKPRLTLKCGKKSVKAVAYTPDGALLATAGDDHKVKLWDPATGKEWGTLKASHTAPECLAFSRDGALLAVGGHGHGTEPGEVKVWVVATRAEFASFPSKSGGAAVAFSPDNRTLAAGGRDGSVVLWDLTTREARLTLPGHTGRVNAVAFADDGATLATGGKDKVVHLCDPRTGVERRTLTGLVCEVRALAFAPGRNLLAVAGCDVRVWDLAADRERLTLKGHRGAVVAVAFAPNGRTVATAGCDKSVRLWDAE